MVKNYELRPYPIRIPPELREKLEAAAKAGNRSLHAEIMQRLEDSFKAYVIPNHIEEMIRDEATAEGRSIPEQIEAYVGMGINPDRAFIPFTELEELLRAKIELENIKKKNP